MNLFLRSSIVFFYSTFAFPSISFSQDFSLKDRSIQSVYDQQNVLVDEEAHLIYFTVANHPENAGGKSDDGDVWAIKYEGSKFISSPFRVKNAWNNKDRNQLLGFLKKKNQAFLNNLYPWSKQGGRKGISNSAKGKESENPKIVKVNSFKNDSENQSLSISSSGDLMILSLESYGTYGAEDLYLSRRNKKSEWSTPRNLGDKINTPFQEISPYLSPDTKYLYFSSNGHGGYGSKDIFVSERLDDTFLNWSTPENLGSEINSEGMESSFSLLGNTQHAVLTSTNNSMGMGDLFIVPFARKELNQKVVLSKTQEEVVSSDKKDKLLKIKVYSRLDSSTLGLVKYTLLNKSETSNSVLSTTNKIELLLHDSVSILSFWLEKEGFEPRKISLDESILAGERHLDVYLNPLSINEEYAIPDLLFVRGTSDLADKEASLNSLGSLVKIIDSNKNLKIEIGGHTDNRGSSKSKNRLSLERANAVRDLILENFLIKPESLSTKGYGSNTPIATNKNESGRSKNRRVSFKLLK